MAILNFGKIENEKRKAGQKIKKKSKKQKKKKKLN